MIEQDLEYQNQISNNFGSYSYVQEISINSDFGLFNYTLERYVEFQLGHFVRTFYLSIIYDPLLHSYSISIYSKLLILINIFDILFIRFCSMIIIISLSCI